MKQELLSLFLSNKNISFEDSQYSGTDINRRLLQVIHNIILKLSKPSTIFIQDSDPLRFSITFFALLDKGHTPIPLSSDFNKFQLKEMNNKLNFFISQDGDIIYEGKSRQKHKNCYACLTSGTTSEPKLCYLSTKNALINAKAHAKSFGINSNHTIIQSLPLHHSFGLISYLWTKVNSNCSIDFNSVFLGMKALYKRKIKHGVLHASPAQLKFMLKESFEGQIEGIDIISFGGGLINTANLIQLLDSFKETAGFVSYGLTEAGPRVTTGRVTNIKADGYIGETLEGITIKILNNKGVLVNEGSGRLCIKSPAIKVNCIPKELTKNKDFLITKDIVTIKNGSIFFHSRQDDIMKVGGISIYSADIENVVKKIPSVNDAIVFPKINKLYGQVPVLVVEGDCCKDNLRNNIKGKLSTQQMPREIVVLPEFPRHSLGKIDRKQLVDQAGLQ